MTRAEFQESMRRVMVLFAPARTEDESQRDADYLDTIFGAMLRNQVTSKEFDEAVARVIETCDRKKKPMPIDFLQARRKYAEDIGLHNRNTSGPRPDVPAEEHEADLLGMVYRLSPKGAKDTLERMTGRKTEWPQSVIDLLVQKAGEGKEEVVEEGLTPEDVAQDPPQEKKEDGDGE